MAKHTEKDWILAKDLFEVGKSLSEINDATGIDRATLSKRSKKDGWEKAKNQQLVIDSARVKAEFSTLSSTAQQVVEKEIDERTRHLQFFTNATIKNCSIMMKKVDSDADFADHKLVQDTLSKGKETVLGKEPSQVINNLNAQQNNEQKTITLIRAATK
jgi:hypothetical protein